MPRRTLAEMVRDQDPLALPPSATVQEACAAMHRRRVGAVLVAEGAVLRGIFTGRDAVRLLAEGRRAADTPLGEVMTRAPVTLRPGDNAMEALRLMNDGGFRHLPVVEEGRVVGIVSRYDFRTEEQRRMDEETGFFEILR